MAYTLYFIFAAQYMYHVCITYSNKKCVIKYFHLFAYNC